MLIHQTTTIGFKLPEEYHQAMRFKAENSDWREDATTQYIYYSHDTYQTTTYRYDPEVDDGK